MAAAGPDPDPDPSPAGPDPAGSAAAGSDPTRSDAAGPAPTEPDPRWLLANERTLLAWIRTGLAIQASGLAVAEFVTGPPRWLRGTIAAALIALGILVCVLGQRHARAVKAAMAEGRAIPDAGMLLWVCAGVVALGTLLGVALLIAL